MTASKRRRPAQPGEVMDANHGQEAQCTCFDCAAEREAAKKRASWFLSEIERRAGATVPEIRAMLKEPGPITPEQADYFHDWLRRILGEPKQEQHPNDCRCIEHSINHHRRPKP